MDFSSSSLNSCDVFLLRSRSGCWRWRGSRSNAAEAQAASQLCQLLQEEAHLLEEGQEPGVCVCVWEGSEVTV